MGILSWIAGPGGWIGDAIKTVLTGPIVQGAVDAYKSKLAAGNDQERIAADLAARELAVEQRERELAVQQNVADEGRWWTAAPRAIACWAFAIFIREMRGVGQGARPRIDRSADRQSRHMGGLAHGALVRRPQRREGRADHRATLTAGQG